MRDIILKLAPIFVQFVLVEKFPKKAPLGVKNVLLELMKKVIKNVRNVIKEKVLLVALIFALK